jgi:hypothetical protein
VIEIDTPKTLTVDGQVFIPVALTMGKELVLSMGGEELACWNCCS